MSYSSIKQITLLEKNLLRALILFVSLLSLESCLVVEKEFAAIPPGSWRAILYLGDQSVPGAVSLGAKDQDNKLPFNFDVEYKTVDSFVIVLKNGPERIVLDDISFGHNRATGRDSIVINFPEYGSYIKAYYEEDILEGRWYVPSKGNYSIPFLAQSGKAERFFTTSLEAENNVAGTWSATFGMDGKEEPWPAVGEFKQKDAIVTGTFLTETGDYRFLEGVVDDRFLWLSCFDGAHAFLFKSNIVGDSMSGFFKSGHRYETLWTATKEGEADLMDPLDITKADLAEAFNFKIIQKNGDAAMLTDMVESGKPTLIQIMGTWCPNCKDETVFLKSYLKDNPDAIQVVSVAFERGDSYIEGYKSIERYTSRMEVPYPVYYGGPADKSVASEVFDQLSGITSFPTTVFLDRNGRIYKVHTGFNGPATSKYEEFKEMFYLTVEQLNKL